jgi:hypothetical protein
MAISPAHAKELANAPAVLLLMCLRRAHAYRQEPFALAVRAMAEKDAVPGLGETALRNATAHLIERGYVAICPPSMRTPRGGGSIASPPKGAVSLVPSPSRLSWRPSFRPSGRMPPDGPVPVRGGTATAAYAPPAVSRLHLAGHAAGGGAASGGSSGGGCLVCGFTTQYNPNTPRRSSSAVAPDGKVAWPLCGFTTQYNGNTAPRPPTRGRGATAQRR